MNQIITYLTFNGNCKEAMQFYSNCLDGKLELQTVSELPNGDNLPDNFKQMVVTASLKKDNMLLMGTDMCNDALIKGNTVSILLECMNEAEIKSYYNRLRVGGISTYPLEKTYWGHLFGGLTDKYGNHWLFYCKEKNYVQSINQ